MTDEEYVFQQTSRERKRIGAGAYARKNGSRTKKCTLPSDNMTAGQIKKRNGEIMQYKLNQPMKWKEFKSMPEDLQKEYIQKLASEKKARAKDVAEMLGIHKNYLSDYARTLFQGETPFTGTHQVNQSQEWRDFIEGNITTPEEKKNEEVNSLGERSEEAETANERVKQPKSAETTERMKIKKGYICYEGRPQEVFSKLILGLNPEQTYGFEILFYAQKEEVKKETNE